MAPIASALRRALLLLLLGAAVGAAVSSWRSRSATPTPAAAPQWPPWPPRTEPPDTQGSSDAPLAEPARRPASGDESAWLPTPFDGTTPETHPIKVKVSSGIYHVPGGRFYDRTRADRCYPTAAAAEADGYRRSKT